MRKKGGGGAAENSWNGLHQKNFLLVVKKTDFPEGGRKILWRVGRETGRTAMTARFKRSNSPFSPGDVSLSVYLKRKRGGPEPEIRRKFTNQAKRQGVAKRKDAGPDQTGGAGKKKKNRNWRGGRSGD